MFSSICLAMLLAPGHTLPRYDSYAPCQQALKNLVESIGNLEKNPHFHYGASLMAGSLAGDGGFRYTITSHEDSENAIVMAGDGSADVLGLDVLDSEKKSVVTKREKDKGRVAITFNAKNGAGYVVVVRNLTKTVDTFVALGLLVDKGGVPISLASISKAANRMSEAIQTGFTKGYGLTPNKCCMIGCMLAPNKPLAANVLGGDRWCQIFTGASDPLTIDVTFKSKQNVAVSPDGVEDGAARFYEFKSSAAAMTQTNTSTKSHFVLTCSMG